MKLPALIDGLIKKQPDYLKKRIKYRELFAEVNAYSNFLPNPYRLPIYQRVSVKVHSFKLAATLGNWG